MHWMNPRTELAVSEADVHRQNSRLLIALSVLLVVLVVVLVKDWGFWFGSQEGAQPITATASVAKTDSNAASVKPVSTPAPRAAITKTHVAAKDTEKPAVNEPVQQNAATPATPANTAVATNRVVLPPLDVEVVAGDSHRVVRPGSNATKLEITNDASRNAMIASSLPANAAARERISAVAAPELRQTIDTTYPLLGQHSRVQGSVVLQAIIGADGSIENLRVVSGPAILTTAAQQAVRQWRFKPYLLNGQPVETKTRITVNFTIRVADETTTASNDLKFSPANGGE